MIFIKSNLLKTEYDWNRDILHSMLVPNKMFFNRFSGDSILRMINLFNSLAVKLSLQDGQEVERLLANELPLQVNDEIGVFSWLKENFKQKPDTTNK